jgi:hypothetical protein
MSLRPLVIGPAEKEAATKVVAYAAAHPYIPGPSAKPPGDDPGHVLHLGTYRAVLSFTHAGDGHVYRNLSISVPGTLWVNPAAAFMIADLLGFTGWDGRTIDRTPEQWIVGLNEAERTIVVAHEAGQAEPERVIAPKIGPALIAAEDGVPVRQRLDAKSKRAMGDQTEAYFTAQWVETKPDGRGHWKLWSKVRAR